MIPAESAAPSIVVRGKVAADDLIVARALHRGGFFMWKATAVLIALLATMTLGDAIRPGGDPGEFRMAWKFAAFAYGLLLFAFLYPRLWHPRESPGLEIEHMVTEDGVQVKDGTEPRFIPWEEIVRSRTSDAMGILYTRDAAGAYVFPQRMFLSREDWTSFCRILRAKTL